MADTKIAYQEIRIDVRDPELTQVYVYIENLSQDGFPVQGWHHKTFPARMSSIEILQAWADGKEDPVMWSFKAPPTPSERLSELADRIDAQDKINEKMKFCSHHLAAQGKPNPRTCQLCGIGPCRFK